MAKQTANVAVALHTQTAEGAIDAAFQTAIDSDQFTTDTGYIIGQPGNGVGDSGLDITLNRVLQESARLAGSFTRPLSTYLATGGDITFAFPFVGNRETASGTPAASEFEPIMGMRAVLQGAYFDGVEGLEGANPAHVWAPALTASNAPNPFSGCIYFNGEKMVFKDARCSLSIDFTAQQVPVATATITPGEIVSIAGTVPVALTPGKQTAVGANNVIQSEFTWGPHLPAVGGFDTMTLALDAAIEDVPDSNRDTGRVVEPSDLAITASGQIYKESTGISFESLQLEAESVGSLSAMSWVVPQAKDQRESAAGLDIKATKVLFPQPELTEYALGLLGTKGAAPINVRASHDSVANGECALYFF